MCKTRRGKSSSWRPKQMLFGKIPFVQGKPNSLCLPIILEQLQLWTSSGIDMPNEKPESLELTNKELQSQDIELVWNRLSGGSEVKLAATWDNKEKTLGEMWESFRQGIDNYIEKFDVPADLEPNETVGKFAVRVLEKMREINGKVITPVLLFWAILQIENNRVYRYFLEQLREKTHNLIQELLYAFWLEVGSAQCELEFDDLMKSHHRGWVVYHGTDRVLLTKEEDPGDIPQTLRDKSIDPNECLIASIRIYQAL